MYVQGTSLTSWNYHVTFIFYIFHLLDKLLFRPNLLKLCAEMFSYTLIANQIETRHLYFVS